MSSQKPSYAYLVKPLIAKMTLHYVQLVGPTLVTAGSRLPMHFVYFKPVKSRLVTTIFRYRNTRKMSKIKQH